MNISDIKKTFSRNWFETKLILFTFYGLASLFIMANIYKNFNSHTTLFSLKTIFISYLFATLSSFLFLKLVERNQNVNDKNGHGFFLSLKLPNIKRQLIYLGIIIISLISFLIFIKHSPTAFQWPGIDMGPFFERSQDTNFAINDFFTNTSSLENPRHIFGNLILKITNISSTDWYTTYFVIKIILVILTPVLFFLSLNRALYKKLTTDSNKVMATLFLIFAVCTVFIERINGIFSIGWWTPNNLSVMPQTLSLLLGLFFSYFALKSKSFLLMPLLFVSTLIHPAIGIFVFWFFVLMDFDQTQIRYYLKLFISSVCLPIVYISYKFSSVTNLSGQDFVHHYIFENHSFHYLPSMLGSFTSFPWYVSFSLINILFIVLIYFGFKFKDAYLKSISVISLLSYSGALMIQYLFVELFPIKAIATISPIRFTLFGYWILALLWTYLIAKYIPKTFVPVTQDKTYINIKLLQVICLSLVIFYLIFGYTYKDDPVQNFSTTYPNLIEWSNSQIPQNSVLATFPNFPPLSATLILKRAVFFGNGFPFTEDGFIENNLRKELIFGLKSSLNKNTTLEPWEETSSYYRSLHPRDFVEASKQFKLDYVILEADHSSNFSKYKPVFENEKIKIYRLTDLTK